MNERIGANGQGYAIHFRLRLPTAWNRRFFFQGGGGTNGALGNAVGPLQGQQPTVALALGYAVVSQDSGHDNVTNDDPTLAGRRLSVSTPRRARTSAITPTIRSRRSLQNLMDSITPGRRRRATTWGVRKAAAKG